MAVLGELNRYPILIKALAQSIKYEHQLTTNSDPDSIIAMALSEMRDTDARGSDCWLSKLKQIKSILGLRPFPTQVHPDTLGKKIIKTLESKFESFWLREVNKLKIGPDGHDTNKLRLYNQLKGSFKTEPYIDTVNNRNQRCSLTRLRISAHHLHLETGRYTCPKPTPILDRTCKYCSDLVVDDESHFLLFCQTFSNKRECFFNKLGTILPNFIDLPNEQKLATILCPATATAAKLSNKYIAILFNNRKKLDEGIPINTLTFPPQVEDYIDDSSDSLDLSFPSCSGNDLDLSNSSLNSTHEWVNFIPND